MMVDQDEVNKISKEVKRYIVKQHMKKHYYSTIGILCFLLGTFFGLLIK
jgi:hypothetical protein